MELTKQIGRGSFGTIFLSKDNGKEVAVKQFGGIAKNYFGRGTTVDICMIMTYQHPHIIQGLKVLLEENKLLLVMELANTSLSYYIEREPEILMKDRIRLVYELGTALQFLADNDIIHCDLKMNNILVKDNSIKLTDFGLANFTDVGNKYCQPDYKYKTPEMKAHRNITCGPVYGKISMLNQVWAYGMISAQILFVSYFRKSKKVFMDVLGEYGHNNIVDAIYDYFQPERSRKIENQPDIEIIHYLSNLLEPDINKRIKTIREFLNDPLFYGYSSRELKTSINRKSLKYTAKNTKETIKGIEYIKELCKKFDVKPRTMFLAFELFFVFYRSIDTKLPLKQIEKNGIISYISLYLAGNLVREDMLERITDTIPKKYDPVLVVEICKKLIFENQGLLYLPTVYDYLIDSQGLRDKSLDYISDYERYKNIGPEKLALKLNGTMKKIPIKPKIETVKKNFNYRDFILGDLIRRENTTEIKKYLKSDDAVVTIANLMSANIISMAILKKLLKHKSVNSTIKNNLMQTNLFLPQDSNIMFFDDYDILKSSYGKKVREQITVDPINYFVKMCKDGRSEILKYILEENNLIEIPDVCFIFAVKYNNKDVYDVLLEYKSNISDDLRKYLNKLTSDYGYSK